MAARRRRRWRRYGIGGLLLALVLVLGDRTGMFEATSGTGDGAPQAVAPQEPPQGKPEDPAGDLDPEAVPQPQPQAAQDPAQLDLVSGLVHRYRQALAAQQLAELTRLEASVAAAPVEVPAALRDAWQDVRRRAKEVLAVGTHLPALLRDGRVLAAHALVTGLCEADAPAALRDRLAEVSRANAWPDLTRPVAVRSDAPAAGSPLPHLRRVRFHRDGAEREGEVWGCTGDRTTVRWRSAAGHSFPELRRHELEPVDPVAAEALEQGLCAARAGDGLLVALWSCHLALTGSAGAAARLRALLQP